MTQVYDEGIVISTEANSSGETQFLLDHSHGQEWRDPSYLHRNTMIIDREVERDSWSTLGRPRFARHDSLGLLGSAVSFSLGTPGIGVGSLGMINWRLSEVGTGRR